MESKYESRTDYINRTALEYLSRHPDKSVRYARRQGRIRYLRYKKAMSHNIVVESSENKVVT